MEHRASFRRIEVQIVFGLNSSHDTENKRLIGFRKVLYRTLVLENDLSAEDVLPRVIGQAFHTTDIAEGG
jgi:hypothetical protein